MPSVLMLLTNPYEPDPRVRQEALALIRMGCRVVLLAWDRDGKHAPSEYIEGIRVERVFLPSTHGRGTLQIFFYAFLYLKLLFRGVFTRFDVVHAHDLDTLPIAAILGVLKRKPIVYDSHESFTDMLEGSVHSLVRQGLVLLENALIRQTSLLITVGEKLRRHFADRGAPRAIVVGNWKRRDEFARSETENDETLRRLGIPRDSLVVACITQLLRDRKIEDLLDAVDNSPGVHLVLGGRGILESLVRQRAERNPRIHYVGYVGARAVADYTSAAGVIFYGFDPANPNARFSAPNKLFEALAAGRPLITGDFGEIADVVRRADCGIVLPDYSAAHISDAFSSLLDPGTRRRLARNADAFGRESMNWEMGEEILHREYSRLLGVELSDPRRSMEGVGSVPAGVV